MNFLLMSCWLNRNCYVISSIPHELLTSQVKWFLENHSRKLRLPARRGAWLLPFSGCWLSYRHSQTHQRAASQAEKSKKAPRRLTHDPFPRGGGGHMWTQRALSGHPEEGSQRSSRPQQGKEKKQQRTNDANDADDQWCYLGWRGDLSFPQANKTFWR